MQKIDRSYTFEFTIIGNGETKAFKRRVHVDQLLERFDQAREWVEGNNDGLARFASVYGPGMQRRVCSEDTREWIVNKVLPVYGPDHVGPTPGAKRIIGLFWADRSGAEGTFYTMAKIVAQELIYEEFEQSMTDYDLEEVAYMAQREAFTWAWKTNWRAFGFWFRRKPALVITGDLMRAQEALVGIPRVTERLETGKPERAPVRYDADAKGPYPFIAPTRSTPEIHRLRARYPTAGEDLAYVPLEILIHRHGHGYREEAALAAISATEKG